MIGKKELINKITDPAISDEEVFKAVKEYCNDESYSSAELILCDLADFQEVGDSVRRVRPLVAKQLKSEVVQNHENCCKPKDP